ncbi:MAG: hypothetical protein AB7N76_09915 [Planctomycetota bacterium]
MSRSFASALLVLGALLAPATQGCSGSSGGQVTGSATANLEVENKTLKTLHVYASGGEIGEVVPNGAARFFVSPGLRQIDFRERGDSFLQSQGVYDFGSSGAPLRLVYDPSLAFNLRVTNTRTDSVQVIVGIVDYGKVIPGGTQTFRIDTGRRDLFFLRTGQSTADYFGTFNFNTTTTVEVSY